MFKKSSKYFIRPGWILLFFCLLPIFYPSFGYSQLQLLHGRVLETLTNNPIQGVQIQAYIAPRNVDGSMEWGNSAFTDSSGRYTFSNIDGDLTNNLDHCEYYFEASPWENNYVGIFYAETATNQQVINPNRATPIDVCSSPTQQLDFTLSNGGSIEGTILTESGGVYTAVDGIRIRASAVLAYPEPTTITVQNDGVEPHYPTVWIEGYEFELIPTNIQVENHVFMRDTYTREFYAYFDPIVGATVTSCNFRVDDTPGHYILQGIALPETNSGNPPTRTEIILNVDSETTRCDTLINYQAAEALIPTFPSPGQTINNTSTHFTLLNGYSIIGSITSAPGPSTCNASLGLYRETTIYLTTVNVTDEGPVTEIYPVTFDKLEAIKGINPIFPDWPDTYDLTGYEDDLNFPGVHLTCDNFLYPRYSNHFTFSNLVAGDYRVEYIEDYIWSVYQKFPTSGHLSIGPSQPTGNLNINVNASGASAGMPPPKVFLNTATNCSPLRLTCWLTGRPPTVCDNDPVPMEPSICHEYTTGNLLENYVLDSRPTHHYIDFYSDANCANFVSTQTVKNYSILNWDTMVPRKCECFNPGQGTHYRIRAVNFYNSDGSTNSSIGECMDSSASYDIRTALLEQGETTPYMLAGIRPSDYLSNTVDKSPISGLAISDQNVHPTPGKKKKNLKKPVPTVQLASLDWTGYLFNLLKKVAGKFSTQWSWDEADGIGTTSYSDDTLLATAGGDAGEWAGSVEEEDSGRTKLFPDLPSLEYVTSNLPDCDTMTRTVINNEETYVCKPDYLPDYWEDCTGLDPNDPDGDNGAGGDPDSDGLLNYWEYFYGTHPFQQDTDNDGMPDGWEIIQDFKPLVDDSAQDADRDGWTNLEEYLNNDDPHQKATTLYVDGSVTGEGTGTQNDPFRTIEQALDASAVSNVILVAGGYFYDPQVYEPGGDLIIAEGRRLIGDGSATTKINLRAGATQYHIEVKDRGSLIGFTIENPPLDAPAVQVSSATAKIANNVLLGSYDSNGSDTGVFLSSSSSDIHNNLIRGFVTGIWLQNSSPDIRNNIINECVSAVTNESSTPAQEYNSFLQDDESLFVDAATDNFHLTLESPLINSGDPSEQYNDLDDSRNDIGPDGGPYGVIDQSVPFVSITTLVNSGGVQYTFDGSGSRDEWGIRSYQWDYDTTEIFSYKEDKESGKLFCDFKENTCGHYLFALKVTDNSLFSASTAIMVKVGNPTPVSFTVTPDIPVARELVEFDGSGNGEFSWSIEYLSGEETIDLTTDCSESSGLLSCTFEKPGLYEVNMNVDDGSCKSMVSKLVTVIGEYDNDAVSESIKADGGTFSVGDEGSSLKGISLDILPKALPEEVLITISKPSVFPDLPEQFTGFSIPFDFGPEGLNFSLPVRLSIPFKQSDLVSAGLDSADYLSVVYAYIASESADGPVWEWEEVPVVEIIEIDQETNWLVVEINHFSDYQIVTSAKPATPEDFLAQAVSKERIMLSWQYSSSHVDDFIIERSYTEDPCNKTVDGVSRPDLCVHDWAPIATLDKNPTNIYTYIDTVNLPKTVYYYRVIASKNRVGSSGEKIKSDPTDEVPVKTDDWQYTTEDDSDDGSGQRTLDLGSDSTDTFDSDESTSGGGASTLFGCGLIHHEPGNGIGILVNILVLFFPLFILRRLALRRR